MLDEKYPPIELKRAYWQKRAQELFLDEFDEPKKFYEYYTDSTIFYHELAKRIVSAASSDSTVSCDNGAAAYQMMYEAFALDARHNDHFQLDGLIAIHKELTNTEGQ